MRHKINTQKLSRFSSFYKATVKSLAQAMIIHQRIVTTKLKAKIAKRLVDQLVTLGKKVDSLSARRRAYQILCDHNLVKKLFNEIGPMFTEKTGGYTRIIPYKFRRGDNAEMVILELSVYKVEPVVSREKEAAKMKDDRKKVVSDRAAQKAAVKKEQIKESKPKKKGGLGKLFKQEKDSL